MIIIKGEQEHCLYFIKINRSRNEISPVAPFHFTGKYPKDITKFSKRIIKHYFKNTDKRLSWYVFASEKEANEFFYCTDALFFKDRWGTGKCSTMHRSITARELDTGILDNVTP